MQSRSSLPASDGLESSHPTCSAESQKEGTARLEGEAARLGELFPYASPLTAGCGVSPALEDQVSCSSSLASAERTWAHRANCGLSQGRTFHQARVLGFTRAGENGCSSQRTAACILFAPANPAKQLEPDLVGNGDAWKTQQSSTGERGATRPCSGFAC